MKRAHVLVLAAVVTALSATVAFADDAPATTPAPAKSTTHHSSTKSTTKAPAKPKVDLNTAAKEDLMKLPGVDEAVADKIVAARPFKSRSELESKNIVTKEQYSKLSAMVTVAPPAKSASK